MKKITILTLFLFLAWCGFSQQPAVRLIEYKPAPGQHINLENIGTPAAAQKMTENLNSLVSLGSFGGHIVLGFEKACINHPDNPYGVDFTVFGNAFSGSAEPGVVWVMQDENQNGLPDDTWYEIAGSHHFYSKTVRNYGVTYFKTDGRDIYWKAGSGETGWVLANSFNLQEYYPTEQLFPQYPRDSVTFRGTLLNSEIDFSNSQEIKITPPAFGYADSHPKKQGVDLFVPDNPYTKEIEGAGGDPIDISWAIDSLGNYVVLDSIHFVKIVSGSLASAGWLGEISTDVAWVGSVQQNAAISGKENLLVIYPHPLKVLVGDSLQIEATYFEKGRKTEASIIFSSRNEQVIGASSAGKVKAKNVGETEITVTAQNEAETISLKVVQPDSISILTDFSAVYPGDSLELAVQVFDDEQEKLEIPVRFTSLNPAVGEIFKRDGQTFFVARQAGETILTSSVEGFEVEKQITVKVLSPDDKIRIYLTVKTADENLLPFQWIEVVAADLNRFVENRQNDYSAIARPVLFHALVAGLQKANVPFVFRDDNAAQGKLYLYSVENDGLLSYGWGGKTEPLSNARAWLVRLNHNQFINNFHQVEISDGDTVALYHVPDITGPWNYSRLTASKDSASTGEEIEVQLLQKTCEFSGGAISETGFVPVANAEIAGTTVYTDEYGKAVVWLETEPPLVISSGNDAVLISKKLTTGIFPRFEKTFQVYPNPVVNELIVEGSQAGWEMNVVFQLFTSGGQLVFEDEMHSGSKRISFSSLPPGIYYLKMISGKKAETHKIVKK